MRSEVEVNFRPPRWRKSARCGANGTCVEIAGLPGRTVAIRDSTDGEDGPVLVLSAAEWRTFLTAVRTGGFERL
jgi:hypothetical protein